jgi:hypothetical protein
MNPFQYTYDSRLREWKSLRLIIRGEPLDKVCVHVDGWWQQAPLVNHHLHPQDTENWPDPWTILSDNIYCTLTRAIGICYTLLMSDIIDVHLVQAVDQQCEEHNLVIVGGAKYILNYYPNSVLSTNLNEFKVKTTLPLNRLQKQIN